MGDVSEKVVFGMSPGGCEWACLVKSCEKRRRHQQRQRFGGEKQVLCLTFLCVCVNHSVMSDSLRLGGLCSLPGSSVQGILQVRILEWVAIPFSRGSSWPRDWTRVSCIAGGFFTVWATRKLYFPLPISKSSPSSRTHIEPPSSWSPPDTSFPVDPSLHPRALKPGMPIWLEQLG